ncbi:MAG: hypothetical protein KDI63_03705 [Gammaproteobacteria bacterium]|nr:hypothetical protein [Gammaproteobacteria bacterium]
MTSGDDELIKYRQVWFSELHPDPNQARTAAELMAGVDGVLEVTAESAVLLNIRYHVLTISLEQIETGLSETGFHLSNRLLVALKRALYYYTEEVQRANNGCVRGDSNCTRKIFVERYANRDHGLKDPRPEHWRHYL